MFRSIIRRFVAWHRRDTAIMKLQSLDDFLLADMGIERDRIGDIVRGRKHNYALRPGRPSAS